MCSAVRPCHESLRRFVLILTCLFVAGGTLAGLKAGAPSIKSIEGATSARAGVVNGRVSMPCGSTWNGSLVVNDLDTEYWWRMNGTNFGASPGTVTIAGRSARIISWAAGRIVAAPTVAYDSQPLDTALVVKTAGGASTKCPVKIVPSVRTRVYGQCTWYVAVTRIKMGLKPSATAYGAYSTIDASYVPKPGDQYQWRAAHTAIAQKVSGPVRTADGCKIWTITIGEYNSRCTNQYNSYSTQFQVCNAKVSQYPQSSVNGLGDAKLYCH